MSTEYLLYPGSTCASIMQAALDAGYKIIKLCLPGNYTFESSITLTGGTHDDITIEAVDGAVIIPPQGLISDADNGNVSCWLKAVPYVETNTSLTSLAKTGQTSITVSNASGITNSSWIKIEHQRDASFDTSTGTFTSNNHTFSNGDIVRLWAGDSTTEDNKSLPSVFNNTSNYYVVQSASNTFKLSATLGGSAISGGTNGNDTIYVGISGSSDIYLQTDASGVMRVGVYQLSNVSGTTLTLKDQLQQYYPVSSKVTIIRPVQNLKLSNIVISNIGGQTASGVRLESVVNSTIDVTGSGFSRAVVDALKGCFNLKIDAKSYGQVNSIVLLHSCHTCDIKAEMRRNISDRTHAYGIPRGLITCYHRCNLLNIHDCFLTESFNGINLRGAVAFTIKNCIISNMKAAAAGTRDPSVLYSGVAPYGKAPGISVCQFIPSTRGEYSRDGSIFNCCIDQCAVEYYQGGSPYKWSSAVILSDVYGMQVDNLHITNKAGDGTALFSANSGNIYSGLALFDCFDLFMGTIRLDGQSAPLTLHNTNTAFIQSIIMTNVTGDGPIDQYGIIGLYQSAGTVKIGTFVFGGLYPFVDVGSSGLTDKNLIIDKFCFNSSETSREVLLAKNNCGGTTSAGEILERNSTGFGTPTSASVDSQYVVTGYGCSNGSWNLAGKRGFRLVKMLDADAVAIGDKIRAAYDNGTTSLKRRGTVDNNATVGNYLGRAISTKTAGVAGSVYIESM